MTLKLRSSIKVAKGVGAKYLQIFHKHGIETIFDLLLYFPIYYIDFSSPARAIDLFEKRVYHIEIKDFKLARLYKRKLSLLKLNAAVIGSEEKIQVVIFNKPYLFESLKKTRQLYIYGKVERSGEKTGIFQVTNPLIFTGLPGSDETILGAAARILPVYNRISSIKSGTLRKLLGNIFAALKDDLECLPEAIVNKYSFPRIVDALRGIHLPFTCSPGEIARLEERFRYREFLYFQLELQYTRNFFKKVNRLNHYVIDDKVREAIKQNLQFELTDDQVTAYQDIVNDLKEPITMQRLLQGDVGSGKTIIAFLALLLAKENGFQGAFLAPTEILANQHFAGAKRFFKHAQVELLTGSTPQAARRDIQEKLTRGEIDIIFGTHALLNEDVGFKNLSLVVIDEQHRFGVSQRAALYYKGNSVDLLVTTATPIPRTMLLSLYHDLSVSLVKTKPHGRLPIITKIIDNNRRDEFYRWLKSKIQAGAKAFIILPLIEESEVFSEIRSIEKESPYFREVFKGIPMGIVSGKTPAQQKDGILDDFAQGKTGILISTTVVEVGIDIPDATIMVIEDADRYGLSQLHQLRGRVGRGPAQSYCYLLPSVNITDSGRQRLNTIAATADGFKIAEIDLEMRGGGIITGLEQSGFLDFKIADIKKDHRVFTAAGRDAAQLLENKSLQNDHISNFLKKVDRKIKSINFS